MSHNLVSTPLGFYSPALVPLMLCLWLVMRRRVMRETLTNESGPHQVQFVQLWLTGLVGYVVWGGACYYSMNHMMGPEPFMDVFMMMLSLGFMMCLGGASWCFISGMLANLRRQTRDIVTER